MENPNFYAIIPASVRYAIGVCPGAKLLYGEISALTNKQGYCFANNGYFSNLYGVSDRTISRWLEMLEKADSIILDYVNPTRRIYIVNPGQKCLPPKTKMSTPPDKNVYHNNTINNTSNNFSLYDDDQEQKNENFDTCVSIEEFRQFINIGSFNQDFPQKEFEKTTEDCFIYYELKGSVIKKKSANAIIKRWVTNNPGYKQELEAWQNSNRRKFNNIAVDYEAEEKQKNAKMLEDAKAYVDKFPDLKPTIEALAYDRAKDIARGNEKIATSLKTRLFYKIAYEMREKELTEF